MSDYLPPVVIELDGRDDKLSRTLEKAKRDIERFTRDAGRARATIKVDVDTASLREARARIRDFTAEVNRSRPTITVGAQLRDRDMAEVRRQVSNTRAADITVRPVLDQAAVRRVQAALRDLGRRTDAQVRPQLDDSAARRAQARLDRLSRDRTMTIRTRLAGDTTDRLGRSADMQANVRPVMDQTALRRVRTVLRELGRRIDVPVRPQLDQSAQRRVQSRLDRLSRNRTVTIRTRIVGDSNGLPGGGGGALGGAGAAAAAGSGGGGGALWGLGAVVATALPSIGALVPMLAGAAAGAGALKLGLSGVGNALNLSGKNADKYQQALDKMSPAQRDFTKALVDVKGQFHDFGQDIQKAMLPGFTQALKDAAPVVKILGKGMTDLGKTFGDAASSLGKLMKDAGFQRDFTQVLKLGNDFVRQLTQSMGPFIQSLLEFGAASGPTLKAFSDGIGGLLSKGLPGLFQGLAPGISGAAQMLDGLFYALNDRLLPALGRLAGEMGKTLGPLFGETFRLLGDIGGVAMDALAGGLKALEPVFKDLTFGLKSIRDLAAIIGPTMVDTGLAIVGAFAPSSDSINKAVGPLQRLNQWINNNKGAILEFSRQFAGAMIDVVSAAVGAIPQIIAGWRMVSVSVLSSISAIIHTSAAMFGWVPGIGPKLRSASAQFDQFAAGYMNGLDNAQSRADRFAADTQKKLTEGKLRLNINNWQQQIDVAKEKLKTVPPSKQSALKATITDLEKKVANANRQLNAVKQGKPAGIRADDSDARAKARRATGSLSGVKQGKPASVRADIGDLIAKVNRAHGILGSLPPWISIPITAVVSVVGAAKSLLGFSAGGYVAGFASGGPIRLADGGTPGGGRVVGPGSETSDSIPAMLSNGEYVVRASSVRKYGERMLDALNAGTLALSARQAAGLAPLPRSASLPLTGAGGGGMVVHQHFEFRIEGNVRTVDGLAKDIEAAFLRRGMRNAATYPSYTR